MRSPSGPKIFMPADFPFQTSGGNGTGVAPARETAAAVRPNSVGGDAEREARIANLKERYRTDKYHVDARTLAACIVEHHLSKP